MKHIIAILVVSFMLASCNSANKQRPSAKYEEKKMSLEDMERSNPLEFLKITGSTRNNLINQTVVEGEITNHATLVAYKDVVVQVVYLDKDGSVIEKQKETINDVVKPNSSNSFKIKSGHVKGTHSVELDIVKAVANK